MVVMSRTDVARVLDDFVRVMWDPSSRERNQLDQELIAHGSSKRRVSKRLVRFRQGDPKPIRG
jgi:hypothetical protein